MMLALGGSSLLASIPAAIVIRQAELNGIEQEFRQEVDEISIALDQELQLNFTPLNGLNILFTGSEEVTSQEFRLVTQQYLAKHPDIQALEWVPYISHPQRQPLEIKRQTEYSNFKLTQGREPKTRQVAEKRNTYFPVAFVEPYQGNEHNLGFDRASDALQRQTLEKSRDSGQDRITPILSPAQNTPNLFFKVSPVYRNQPQTPQERRLMLRGFVVGSYRLDALLANVGERATQAGLSVQLIDQTNPQASQLLYAGSHGTVQANPSDLTRNVALSTVPGRTWVMVAQATPDFIHQHNSGLFLLLPFLGVVLLWAGGSCFVWRLQQSANREQDRYFQRMAHQSPALMWVTDADMMFSFFNQTWLTVTGRTTDAEIGDGWMSGIHPNDRQQWQKTYESSFSQQQEFSIEHRLRQNDGSYAWMLSMGKPRYTLDEKFCGYIGTTMDITAMKQAEAQCQMVNTELLRSNQELEQMASALSHDMREPLRKIKSFAELVQADYVDDIDEKGQRYFDYVIDGSERMQAMIADLLAYARLSSEAREVALTDLGQVVKQVQQDLSLTIAESEAVIEVGDLPEIMINPTDIQRVFQNLLSNALKFRGDAVPHIQIAARQLQKHWLITVEDNGIGILEDAVEDIFVMFKRLHKRTDYDGTGIGLAICKKIIDHYDGSIWAESKPGEGTTFHVKLPSHFQDHWTTDRPFVSVFDF